MKNKYTKKEKKVLHNWVDTMTDNDILILLNSMLSLYIIFEKSYNTKK